MPHTDLPSPPPLRRASERVVQILVYIHDREDGYVRRLFSEPVPVDNRYIIVSVGAGDKRDHLFMADIGVAKIGDKGVYLDHMLEPPGYHESNRSLLVVSGPAVYMAMGYSSSLARLEDMEHPSVCVLPDALPEEHARTIIAIHLLALYRRLHSV